MALQIKAKQKVCNINILCGFVADYDRFSAKDGLEQLRTLPDTSFQRLCAVSWQLAGSQDQFRPMEPPQ
jgi:hypothetical protein